ncbi:MAG: hypothetical protein KDE09_10885 [Anaerolineales bacterium]|nr:hypothetical protein [Anaerolineales bacterium]MCB0018285.1 hypothetical protein [Anaerolineales bacterium]
MSKQIEIFLESGKKKVFAGAINWPGWGRLGKDESTATANLLLYAPRYAEIAARAGLNYTLPTGPDELSIVARVAGSTTTDFGATDAHLPIDETPLTEAELARYEQLLRGCWAAFDQTVLAAEGQELRKGPRGGGRELDKIVAHVIEADESYLRALGWKPSAAKSAGQVERLAALRQDVWSGLKAAAAGEIPRQGPRGGVRWQPRYFVRRLAWHLIDHQWEIEDRII